MRRWVLIAGFSGEQEDRLRQELEQSGYEVVPLSGSNPDQWQRAYAQFSDEHKTETPLWIGLVGQGAAADDFAHSYYGYYRSRPPHVIILVSTHASVLELNQLACPFLVIHHSPGESFRWPVYHHQMRYGDPTRALCVSEDQLPRVVEAWLKFVPNLGYSKEGIHARGFRIRPPLGSRFWRCGE